MTAVKYIHCALLGTPTANCNQYLIFLKYQTCGEVGQKQSPKTVQPNNQSSTKEEK